MTETATLIKNVKANGEAIFNLVNDIETAMEKAEASKAEAVIACLAIALSIQYPDISEEDRVDGVQDISRYICLWVEDKINKDLGIKVVAN